jgi:hypothetical protein
MRGLSITICFGSYGGFYAYIKSMGWRVCLGWIAITIYPKTDIEAFIQFLRKKPKDEPLDLPLT